jgi:hypothetical protein
MPEKLRLKTKPQDECPDGDYPPRLPVHHGLLRKTKKRMPVRNPNPYYQPIPWLLKDFCAFS